MQRKTGVLIFTHGPRLKEGNEIFLNCRPGFLPTLATSVVNRPRSQALT
jgi:hypothetical protein